MTKVTQRNATRNQSNADYEIKKIFIFDNRFVPGTFENVSGGAVTLEPGTLMLRSLVTADGFVPAIAGATLANVVGISANEDAFELADAGLAPINVATKGTVDGNLLTLPGGVTLDTVVGNKTVKDILEGIGFHIDTSAVEHTKFDN